MSLLLVDAANILMRCAFGGEMSPNDSTPKAVAMIERAIAHHGHVSHLVIALDFPDAPTWRHLECPTYKADRTIDTSPWLAAGAAAFARRGWHCVVRAGFEADDIIATIALRSVHTKVSVLSGDSDLLPLTVQNILVVKPLVGGEFQVFQERDVCEKYRIPRAHVLFDYKALVGEEGIPGVPLIGAKRAAELLQKFGDLEGIIHAGSGGFDKWSGTVALHATTARTALRLVSLRVDVPVPPIAPKACALSVRAA